MRLTTRQIVRLVSVRADWFDVDATARLGSKVLGGRRFLTLVRL